MKDEKKNKKMMRAVGSIGDDLLTEAIGDEKRAASPKMKRRKAWFAVLASVLLLSIVAGSIAIIVANRPASESTVVDTTCEPSETDPQQTGTTDPQPTGTDPRPIETEPIVFTGEAYSNGAATELPEALQKVKISVNGSDERLIGVDSVFTIETNEDCDEETLLGHLSVSPQTEFTIRAKNKRVYEIAPAKGALESGTVYKVTVGDPENPTISYAFQTETALAIRSTIPADMSVSVPTNTAIEFAFTEPIEETDFSKYFEILPGVSGKFMLYSDGRTLAFIPTDPLTSLSTYFVTLKEGLTARSGRVLKSEKIFTFTTGGGKENGYEDQLKFTVEPITYKFSEDDYRINFGGVGLGMVFSPGEEAYARYRVYGSRAGGKHQIGPYKFSATLYRFPSAAAAYEFFKNNEQNSVELLNNGYQYDLSAMDEIKTVKTEYDPSSDTSNSFFCAVPFGSDLQNGVYLVKLDTQAGDIYGKTHRATTFSVLQISDLRAAAVTVDGSAVLYAVNSDGTPAAGAELNGSVYTVKAYSSRYYKETINAKDFISVSLNADKDGLMLIDTKKSDMLLAILKQGDDEQLLSFGTQTKIRSNIYQHYFYTDRTVYFSSDRINFYGYLVPAQGAELPKKIYLAVGSTGLRIPVEVNEDGSFTGSYAYEDHDSGSNYLSLVDEDGWVIASVYTRVTREEKPLIRAELTLDKTFAAFGEKVTGTVKASYFDGAPAAGYKFTIRSYTYLPQLSSDEGVTDENGEWSFTFTLGEIKAYSTDPVTISIGANCSGYDTQKIYCRASLVYFHSDKVLRTAYEDDACVLLLNERDLSGYPDDTIGVPAAGTVSYFLYRRTYTKQKHTGYDTYTKLTYTYYSYKTNNSQYKSGSADFVNGRISLDTYSNSSDEYYYYDILYNDGRNLYKVSMSANKRTTAPQYYDTFVSSRDSVWIDVKDQYLIGEQIEAKMYLNNNPVDRALYVRSGLGLIDYMVADRYTGVFGGEGVVGGYMTALYYDPSSGIFDAGATDVRYNYREGAALEVEIETDKEVYDPGEEATIRIRIKNGACAQAIISLVDEACFALGEQKTDPLDDVFTSLASYPNVNRSARSCAGLGMSYADYSIDGVACGKTLFAYILSRAASNLGGLDRDGMKAEAEEPDSAMTPNEEKGDSSEVYIRKYFADNPEFTVITLDEQGVGKLVTKIPDNMTSWRITCSAVKGLGGDNADLRAGTAQTDVICTRPFYLSPSFCSQYIVGDDCAFNVRAIGAGISGEVTCKAQLFNEKDELTAEKTMTLVGNRGTFNFGKLEAGVYKIVVIGFCGEYSDGVEKKIAFTESAAITDIGKDVTPESISQIKPALYPITLSFNDESESYRLFSRVISKLAYSSSVRIDAIVSKYAALAAREKLFGVSSSLSVEELRTRLNNYGSLYFSMLGYSDEDPILTAQLLAIDPSIVAGTRRESMIISYRKIVNSTEQKSPEELCASLLALAALDDPVLLNVCDAAASAGKYSLEAKFYLAAAFAYCGDYPSARDILFEIFESDGVRDDQFGTLYIAANTKEEQVRLTGLALLACSRVSKVEAEMLASYLIGDTTYNERASTALAAFVRYYMPTGILTDKNIVVHVGGIEKTLTVRGLRTTQIVLGSKAELESFSIVSMDEDVGVRAYFKGSLTEVENNENSRVKIDKTVKYSGNNLYTVTLNITGTSTRIYNHFDLYDYIPSGARYLITNSGSTNYYGTIRTYWSIYNSDAQEMRGYLVVYNKGQSYNGYNVTCGEYSFSVQIVYTIRGAVQGEYVVERAVIRDNGDSYAMSDRSKITIV